ncbi:MAG: hypothetical protein ACK46R_05200, partial [Bacteroidota bacterium]
KKRTFKPTHKDKKTMDRNNTTKNKQRTANNTYPKGGVSCFKDSFVVAESSVLRTNFCAKKPAHRKPAKR